MQTCPGFFLKSLLECPGNLLEICSVKFVDTLDNNLVMSRNCVLLFCICWVWCNLCAMRKPLSGMTT